MASIITEYPQYFTATILQWKKLLQPEKYKDIITGSLQFLVTDKRIKLFSFVIMDNHIHLIWQMQWDSDPEAVQRDFLKYTAQRIKKDLQKNHPAVLSQFKVDAKDREYQFWKRNPLSVELRTHAVFRQKLDYIHWNPVKAGMCKLPEEYEYSSALFYETGVDNPSVNSGRFPGTLPGLSSVVKRFPKFVCWCFAYAQKPAHNTQQRPFKGLWDTKKSRNITPLILMPYQKLFSIKDIAMGFCVKLIMLLAKKSPHFPHLYSVYIYTTTDRYSHPCESSNIVEQPCKKRLSYSTVNNLGV